MNAIVRAVIVGIVAAVASAIPASAYVDVGHDPAGDGSGKVRIVDIVASKRAVWRNDAGHRWLKVSFRAVDPVRRTNVDVEARIDSRGDEHADDIRWRLVSRTPEGGPGYHVDRAPDHGWYR